MLAVGLNTHDPPEAYRVDLMTGTRERVQDKEAALSYLRNASVYEMMREGDLLTQYPAVMSALNHLGEPSDTALKRITGLLQRHGQSVVGVIRKELENRKPNQFSTDSLPNLFGDLQRGQVLPISDVRVFGTVDETPKQIDLVFDRKRNLVVINDTITLKKAAYRLLQCLADKHLEGAGRGLDLLDYPTMAAGKLADRLDLADEGALRQSVSRVRTQLGQRFASAGYDADDGKALIENLPWSGYRLNPERVIVRVHSPQ